MTLTGVYDTNVIVSAILKPGSIPASLVALAMEGSVRLFLTPAVLEEYREVLRRPKFAFVQVPSIPCSTTLKKPLS